MWPAMTESRSRWTPLDNKNSYMVCTGLNPGSLIRLTGQVTLPGPGDALQLKRLAEGPRSFGAGAVLRKETSEAQDSTALKEVDIQAGNAETQPAPFAEELQPGILHRKSRKKREVERPVRGSTKM